MTSPENLRSRARALRLRNSEIAQRARLDENTVGRFFRGGNYVSTTRDKIAEVVAAEEAAQLARLGTAAQ